MNYLYLIPNLIIHLHTDLTNVTRLQRKMCFYVTDKECVQKYMMGLFVCFLFFFKGMCIFHYGKLNFELRSVRILCTFASHTEIENESHEK